MCYALGDVRRELGTPKSPGQQLDSALARLKKRASSPDSWQKTHLPITETVLASAKEAVQKARVAEEAATSRGQPPQGPIKTTIAAPPSAAPDRQKARSPRHCASPPRAQELPHTVCCCSRTHNIHHVVFAFPPCTTLRRGIKRIMCSLLHWYLAESHFLLGHKNS